MCYASAILWVISRYLKLLKDEVNKVCIYSVCILGYKNVHALQKGKCYEVLSTFILKKLERKGAKSIERRFKKVFYALLYTDLATMYYR